MIYKNKENESKQNTEIKKPSSKEKFHKNSSINNILRNNNKKLLINIFALILFTISYHYYYLSLEKCLEGIHLCSKKWNWIIAKIKQLIISVIIIFTYFYKYSHSSFYYDHGAFNLIFFFFLTFLFMLFLLIIQLIMCISKTRGKYKLLLSILLLFYYNLLVNPTNCDDWPKGLNNTYIENNNKKYGCKIVFPKNCYYKILQFTQDISRLYMNSCSNKDKSAKQRILKSSKSSHVNKNTMKFGFPLTINKVGRIDDGEDRIIKRYTFKNLLDMDKPLPSGFKKPEYIVDFSKDPYGELIINLNFNNELSKKRKKLEQKTNPYSDNILILYIDSISRANSMRKLKKTVKFFEKFISYKGGYNEKYPNENFHSFQFFKYHSFKGNTPINFPILFYGNKPNVKDFVRMTKYIKQNGYVTCYASDYCNKDNVNTLHNISPSEEYDHQLLMCDPNVLTYNSIIKRCLYGNINSYYLYEYMEQFWRKYQNNRKFSLLLTNDGHEGTLEVVKYTDDIIYNFLNSLFNDNLLKDTTIFLLSDHGSHMPSIYYLYDFYQIERRLPALYMIINDRKNKSYFQQYLNIHENQQTFITGYDIYNTIGNIIYGDYYNNINYKKKSHDTPKSPLGQSLFDKINAKERKAINYSKMDTFVCI